MKERKKIVVLTGSGISAESGISTFRDSDGLWENHRVEDVATYHAWLQDRALVLNFYNQRRRQLGEVKPNAAHYALAELEEKYDVTIITQNVDDLHERAGSTRIIHLHGELVKARSTKHEDLVYDIQYNDILEGDLCERGAQLRPHIVWFGEMVPMMEEAAYASARADIFIVVGTSLVVYPAAGLVGYAPSGARKYAIDPKPLPVTGIPNLEFIQQKAGVAVPPLVKKLLEEA
ncbi:NAD-dependent deacylase [Lentimicrobium sp.]